MIIDLIGDWSNKNSLDRKSPNYTDVDSSNFADKLALAKLKIRCQALKKLQKYEFHQQRAKYLQHVQIDKQETEHIRFVKYVNNKEIKQGINKQAMFM